MLSEDTGTRGSFVSMIAHSKEYDCSFNKEAAELQWL